MDDYREHCRTGLTQEGKRMIMQFLYLRGQTAEEAHKAMTDAYGANVVGRSTVFENFKR